MSASILIFPGSNREQDMTMALQAAGIADISMIWHKETEMPDTDLIVLPGGFSYGDYLRCGAMAAHSPIMQEVIHKAKRGTPVLGVCNGFQILIETGLLPGALLRNHSLHFVCRQVTLSHEAENGLLAKGAQITVPVAHGEGNYFADEHTCQELADHDQIAFRYIKDTNPNGSVADIAGIYSRDKKILGMMPHPENATCPHHANQSAELFFQRLIGQS